MSLMNLVSDAPRERCRFAWDDLLERHRLFAGFSESEIGRLLGAEASRERTVAAGEVILEQGQPGDSVFFVGTGSVKVSLTEQGQPPLELALLRKGDFFGEMVLFEPGPRSATVTALQECVLLEVSSEALRELMIQHPALELALLHTMTDRLRNTNERILSLKLREVPEALRLLEARLGAEVRVFDASLKAAHTVFEQTRVRTDEVIGSADRTRSRLTYVASTIVTVFTLSGMALGGLGLGGVMDLRKWVAEARKAATISQEFKKLQPELTSNLRFLREAAADAKKVKETLAWEQIRAIRTALDQGQPTSAIADWDQLRTLGWLNDKGNASAVLNEVELALLATRDPSGVVSKPQQVGRTLPDFKRLLDHIIETATDPKTRARAYLLRLVSANLETSEPLGDDDKAALAKLHELLEEHRGDGLLSGAEEWEHDDFLQKDPKRREAFRKALRQVTAAIPKNESPRGARGQE